MNATAELEGQIAVARVAVERAKLSYQRVKKLRLTQNETAEREDQKIRLVGSAIGRHAPGDGIDQRDRFLE